RLRDALPPDLRRAALLPRARLPGTGALPGLPGGTPGGAQHPPPDRVAGAGCGGHRAGGGLRERRRAGQPPGKDDPLPRGLRLVRAGDPGALQAPGGPAGVLQGVLRAAARAPL
ncbi:MAG: hypothetical protein AVDCRST_MAG88-3634, partial [uncultured Thermomicrobiales bacterium]